MPLDVMFAGFGGQGIMLIGQMVAYAGMAEGKQVSWLPSYGPEMRGGTAYCSVVVSDGNGSPACDMGGPMLALDATGWTAVLYLSVLCPLLGYWIWTWLLRHLPASTLGFTVFFNPPLTTTSKMLLSLLFPAVFIWPRRVRMWMASSG